MRLLLIGLVALVEFVLVGGLVAADAPPQLLPPREPSPANAEDGGPAPQDPRDRSGLPIPESPPERRASVPMPPPAHEPMPSMPDPAFPAARNHPPEQPPAPAPADFPKPGRLPDPAAGPLERGR